MNTTEARAALSAADYSGEWMVGGASSTPYVETTQIAKAGRDKGVRYGLNVWATGVDPESDGEREFALAEAQLIATAVNALPEAIDELTRLKALLAEACSTGREIAVIGLDLANGRTPSISTSEMLRSRMDRLAEIRKEGGL